MSVLLADAVMLLHAAFSVFVVAGLPIIAAGALFDWSWTQKGMLRPCHLICTLIVSLRACSGAACPFSAWEDSLRGGFADQDGLHHVMHHLAFRPIPETSFRLAAVGFLALTVLAYGLGIVLNRWRSKQCPS